MFEIIARHMVRQVRKEFSDMRFKTYMYDKYRSWSCASLVNNQANMEGLVYV